MRLDGLGETGVPGAQGVPPLSGMEVATMREVLSRLHIVDPEITDEIIWRVYELRGMEKMRLDAEPVSRRSNLKRSIKLVRAGKEQQARRILSSKNDYALTAPYEANPDISLIDALSDLKANLPIRGRGRSPANGQHYIAVYIAHLLETNGYKISNRREGVFVRVLALVFSVALQKRVSRPHRIAARALRNRTNFVNGLMEIPVNP